MNYKQLAKTIRTQKAQYDATTTELRDQMEATKNQCKHKLVVIVCSDYAGSYSQDYDDGHGEIRKCLICGISEMAQNGKFTTLTDPFKRLELGNPYSRHSRYQKSPLANCFAYSLADLLRWVEQNGWQI